MRSVRKACQINARNLDYGIITSKIAFITVMNIKLSLKLILAVPVFVIGVSGQIIVGLRLDESTPTSVGKLLFCDAAFKCGLFPSENRKRTTYRDKSSAISVERDGKDFLITVDANGRHGLNDEKKMRLANNGSLIVKIEKQVAPGQRIYLPYEITHAFENEKGNPFDQLFMRAHYILRGKFRDRGCVMDMALSDFDANGKFNLSNGDRGTNLQIDRNKDGKFWGKGEFVSTNEIVELCGRNYLVSALSYSRIIFKPTSLKLARVGEKTIDFSIDLKNGTHLSPASLKGRAYILDFWASWCQPCVSNLPHIRKLRDEFKGSADIFTINVDKPARHDLAERIIKEKDLADFTSIRGLGSVDPIWQGFGGGNQNHLGIPLYVLVDKDGIVKYLGNGGEDLVELKAVADKFIRP